MFKSITDGFKKTKNVIVDGYGGCVNAVGNNIPGAGVKTYGNHSFSTIGSFRLSPEEALKNIILFRGMMSGILGIREPDPISAEIISICANSAAKNRVKEINAVKVDSSTEPSVSKAPAPDMQKQYEAAMAEYEVARKAKIAEFLTESEKIGKTCSSQSPKESSPVNLDAVASMSEKDFAEMPADMLEARKEVIILEDVAVQQPDIEVHATEVSDIEVPAAESVAEALVKKYKKDKKNKR